jgi:hypothetical protein
MAYFVTIWSVKAFLLATPRSLTSIRSNDPMVTIRRLTRRTLMLGLAGVAGAYALGARSVLADIPSQIVEINPTPIRDPSLYDVYIPAACKAGDFFYYSCEFDAAWAVLKTFGIEAGFDEQLAIVGQDQTIEPYYQNTPNGIVIHGGDISTSFCGDYRSNLLARARGSAVRKVFKHYGLQVSAVSDRADIKGALKSGRLVWIKTTVDFLDWVPATWLTPDGDTFPAVLGNDHAAIVIGYTDDIVVMRDVLGPTDTNWNRQYEYEVPWDLFLKCWGAQGNDGLAVGIRDSE